MNPTIPVAIIIAINFIIINLLLPTEERDKYNIVSAVVYIIIAMCIIIMKLVGIL